jgi:hypothetical protein
LRFRLPLDLIIPTTPTPTAPTRGFRPQLWFWRFVAFRFKFSAAIAVNRLPATSLIPRSASPPFPGWFIPNTTATATAIIVPHFLIVGMVQDFLEVFLLLLLGFPGIFCRK